MPFASLGGCAGPFPSAVDVLTTCATLMSGSLVALFPVLWRILKFSTEDLSLSSCSSSRPCIVPLKYYSSAFWDLKCTLHLLLYYPSMQSSYNQHVIYQKHSLREGQSILLLWKCFYKTILLMKDCLFFAAKFRHLILRLFGENVILTRRLKSSRAE